MDTNEQEDIYQKRGLMELLIEAQATIEQPKLDGEVITRKYSYKYATLKEIMRVIHAACKPLGLYVGFDSEVIDGETYIGTLVSNGKETAILCRFPINGKDGNVQEWGKEVTYTKRYSASSAFGLVADEDDDCATEETVKTFSGVGRCLVCGTRYQFQSEEQMRHSMCQCGAMDFEAE